MPGPDRALAARIVAMLIVATPELDAWTGDVLGAVESALAYDEVWRPLLRALIRRLGNARLAPRLKHLAKAAVAGRHQGARRYLLRQLLRNPALAGSVEEVWVEQAVVGELASDGGGKHTAARLIALWIAARGLGAPWLARTVEAWPTVLGSPHLDPETSRRLLSRVPSTGGWLALASRVVKGDGPMAFSVVELGRHVDRAMETLEQAYGEAPRADLRRVLRGWMDDLGVIPS